MLHGGVYDLSNGLIKDLKVTVHDNSRLKSFTVLMHPLRLNEFVHSDRKHLTVTFVQNFVTFVVKKP